MGQLKWRPKKAFHDYIYPSDGKSVEFFDVHKEIGLHDRPVIGSDGCPWFGELKPYKKDIFNPKLKCLMLKNEEKFRYNGNMSTWECIRKECENVGGKLITAKKCHVFSTLSAIHI